jgi:hypothetical protein
MFYAHKMGIVSAEGPARAWAWSSTAKSSRRQKQPRRTAGIHVWRAEPKTNSLAQSIKEVSVVEHVGH